MRVPRPLLAWREPLPPPAPLPAGTWGGPGGGAAAGLGAVEGTAGLEGGRPRPGAEGWGGVSRPGLAPLRRTERAPAAGWKEGRREGGRPEAAGGPVRVVALRPRPERESPQALLEPR